MRLGLSAAVWRLSILFHNGGTVGRFVIPVLLILSIFNSNTKRQRNIFSAVFASLALQGYGVALFGGALCLLRKLAFCDAVRCGISCKTYQTHHTQNKAQAKPERRIPGPTGRASLCCPLYGGEQEGFSVLRKQFGRISRRSGSDRR